MALTYTSKNICPPKENTCRLEAWQWGGGGGGEVMKHNQIKCNQTFFSSWRFLGLGNLAWVFLVVNFWFRESWVLILSLFNQPCHLKSEYPPWECRLAHNDVSFLYFPVSPLSHQKERKRLEYEHSISCNCWHPLQRVHYPPSLGVCR